MSTPSLTRLTAGLNAALGTEHEKVAVLDRRNALSQSTFAAEILTCQIGARRRRLFCKYSTPYADATGHRAYGLRRGTGFEADVYERVLQPLGVSVPALRGTYRDAVRRETWLLLEFLNNATKLHKDPAFMPEAAAWIGTFHALVESRLLSPEFAFLRRYDAGYYRGWADRVLRYAKRHRRGGRWLPRVCEGFEDTIQDLLGAPKTVIHGEYYPANVLVRKGQIRPVDWETAAVACGEIDVATLTEGWSASISRECERAYRRARWPDRVPRGFQRRMQAARFYLLVRWAGEPSNWKTEGDRDFYVAQLRATGERLGLC